MPVRTASLTISLCKIGIFGCQPFRRFLHRESVKVFSEPPATPRWLARLVPVLVAMGGGFATVAFLIVLQRNGAELWVVNAAMLLPGAICMVVVPSSRRRWYRWLVLLALAQVVHPWVTAPFLLIGTAWALWRAWVDRPASRPAGVRPVPPSAKKRTVPAGAR